MGLANIARRFMSSIDLPEFTITIHSFSSVCDVEVLIPRWSEASPQR